MGRGGRALNTPPFTVLADTREQKPWTFAARKGCPCLGSRPATLKTGDYTIEGAEGRLVIERKGSVAELMGNLGEARFARELDRMAETVSAGGVAALVLEFSLEQLLAFPKGSSVPRSRWASLRLKGPYALRRICEAQLRGIQVVFAGSEGRSYALSLMKRASERWLSTP